MDTEEIKRPSHIDDGVPRLRLRPRSKLDDLLGSLEELRHSRPRTVHPRTLEREKRRDRQVESHSGRKATIPMTAEYLNKCGTYFPKVVCVLLVVWVVLQERKGTCKTNVCDHWRREASVSGVKVTPLTKLL